MPGILNDVGDWVEATRLKSIQLLYIMIWQCESNITMNLETVLQTLFKASQEPVELVQKTIFDCARLLGHFVDASLALKLAFKSIRRIQPLNPGAVNILNGLLTGHDTTRIPFELLIEALTLLQEIGLTTEVTSSSVALLFSANVFNSLVLEWTLGKAVCLLSNRSAHIEIWPREPEHRCRQPVPAQILDLQELVHHFRAVERSRPEGLGKPRSSQLSSS